MVLPGSRIIFFWLTLSCGDDDGPRSMVTDPSRRRPRQQSKSAKKDPPYQKAFHPDACQINGRQARKTSSPNTESLSLYRTRPSISRLVSLQPKRNTRNELKQPPVRRRWWWWKKENNQIVFLRGQITTTTKNKIK